MVAWKGQVTRKTFRAETIEFAPGSDMGRETKKKKEGFRVAPVIALIFNYIFFLK